MTVPKEAGPNWIWFRQEDPRFRGDRNPSTASQTRFLNKRSLQAPGLSFGCLLSTGREEERGEGEGARGPNAPVR